MKIQPTQTPSFGMNYTQKIYYDNRFIKHVTDTVHLDNGKKVIISKCYDYGNLTSKLQYLKDEAGNWVKSKLKCYKNGKAVKTITSKKEV